MGKYEVSVLGVGEVRWKEQREIIGADFNFYYSEGERCYTGAVRVMYKNRVRNVIKKTGKVTESLLLR